MKINKSGIPQVQGFYFVKLKQATTWQLFVRVVGVAPFMGIEDIKTIFKSTDKMILGDIRDVVWSEIIDMRVNVDDVHYGYTIPDTAKQTILGYIKEGSKLQAVKFLKDYSRDQLVEGEALGLKEAKEYIDIQADILKREKIFG